MPNKQIVLSDSNLAAAAMASASAVPESHLPVFIDTSLDTHLLMVFSQNDTVSDFKRKIEKEHTLCFTNIGDIVVHALKVKRRGHLYHLSDSMLVKDAFAGVNKNWFLSVDASTVEKKHDEKKHVENLDSNNLLPCFDVALANGVDLCLNHSPEQGTSDTNKGIGIPRKHIELKSDAPRHDILEQQAMAVEVALQVDIAPKKKRQIEQVVGNGSLPEEKIDSGKETSKPAVISEHSTGDKEKSEKGAVDGLTAKPVDDNHLVTSNSPSIHHRKKRKKSKGKVDNVADGAPSSGKDVLGDSYFVSTGVDHKDSGLELNTASVSGQGEDGMTTSKLKQKNSDTAGEAGELEPSALVGHKTAATEEEMISIVNKVENSKDHFPVMKEPKERIVVEDSGHKDIGNDQSGRAEEQGGLSRKNDSIRTLLNGLDSPRRDQTDVQTKAINVNAESVDKNGTIAPTDTGKKRKRTKTTKDPVGKFRTTQGGEDVQRSETNVSVEPFATKSSEQLGDKAKDEESNLAPTNGNEVLKGNMDTTFVAKEDDGIAGNEVKSMQKRKGKVEEEPVKKKSKKKQNSSAKNLPDVRVEEKNVIHQNPTPPTIAKTEVVVSSNTKKKTKAEKRIKDQLNEGKLESENSRVKNDPVRAELDSVSAKSTQARSHSLDHDGEKGNHDEAELTDNPNKTEVSEVGNKSNHENPLPDTVASSEIHVVKKTEAKKTIANRAADTPKARKNVKKPDAPSVQTSSNVQSSLKSKERKQIEVKPPAGNSAAVPLQESSLKEKSDESMVPEKKLTKASKNVAKAPPYDTSNKLNSVRKEAGKQNVVNVTGTNVNSQKNADSASVVSSRLERPKKITSQSATSIKRQSGVVSNHTAANISVSNKNNNRATANSPEPKKKSVATPGSIFKDDSGASSDEEGSDSDASTKAPSDYSSDYSDGESNANMNSPERSLTLDRMKSVDRENIIKSCSSSGKDLTFDSILRSSSRYKKAKMTASQLQHEDESQPIDFVPDSQAN